MTINMESRRQFLRKMATIISTIVMGCNGSAKKMQPKKQNSTTHCDLYRAVNGNPATNFEKVIDLVGGIEKIIGSDDIVVIKPNVQWWNQGVPKLAALKKTY
jgi:hypothetical protein